MQQRRIDDPGSAMSFGPGVEVDPAAEIGAGALITGMVEVLGATRIGPGVIVEGPRLGHPLTIGPDAVVGAGSVISMASIGGRAVLQPGSVVTRRVPSDSVIGGSEGRLLRTRPGSSSPVPLPTPEPTLARSPREVLLTLRLVDDLRGALVAGEYPAQLPFAVSRFFTVFGVPGPEVRGEHAHLACHQLLIAVAGSLEVICDDGFESRSYSLSRPEVALHIPPMTWGVQHQYSSDAVLLVLASHAYDPDDYVRDYDEFKRLAHARASGSEPPQAVT